MKNTQKLTLLLLLLAFCFVGCAEKTSKPSDTYPPTQTRVIPSLTTTSELVSPKTSTAEPTEVKTMAAEPTSTTMPTELPVMASTPTQDPEVAKQILELYTSNAGCELPCWWGIIPGETDWTDAQGYLAPLTQRAFAPYSYPKPMGLENYSAKILIPVEHDTPWSKEDQVYVVEVESNTVTMIYAPAESIENYQIPALLEDYGQPNETLIIVGYGFGGKYLVSLYMHYPEYSFLATHRAVVDPQGIQDGIVTACFQESSELFMWSKDQEMSYKDMIPIGLTDFAEESIEHFQNISDVTKYNENSFYKAFLNSDLPICIEVQTDFWFKE